jgi:hypothetical protein
MMALLDVENQDKSLYNWKGKYQPTHTLIPAQQ